MYINIGIFLFFIVFQDKSYKGNFCSNLEGEDKWIQETNAIIKYRNEWNLRCLFAQSLESPSLLQTSSIFKPQISAFPQRVPYSCELLLFVQDWANLQWLCSYKECIFQCFDLMTIIQAEVSSFLTLFSAPCGKPLCHCSPQKKKKKLVFSFCAKTSTNYTSSVAYDTDLSYLFNEQILNLNET